MLRYRLRTLLMVMALGPAVLAGGYLASLSYNDWREDQRFKQELRDRWEQRTGDSLE
jgi:hypothetical protein